MAKNVKRKNELNPDGWIAYSVAEARRGSAGELFDRLIDRSNRCERNDDVSSSSSSIIIFPDVIQKFLI